MHSNHSGNWWLSERPQNRPFCKKIREGEREQRGPDSRGTLCCPQNKRTLKSSPHSLPTTHFQGASFHTTSTLSGSLIFNILFCTYTVLWEVKLLVLFRNTLFLRKQNKILQKQKMKRKAPKRGSISVFLVLFSYTVWNSIATRYSFLSKTDRGMSSHVWKCKIWSPVPLI